MRTQFSSGGGAAVDPGLLAGNALNADTGAEQPGIVERGDSGALEQLPEAGQLLQSGGGGFSTHREMQLAAAGGDANSVRRNIQDPQLLDDVGVGAQAAFDQHETTALLNETAFVYDNTLPGRGHNPVTLEDVFASPLVFPMHDRWELGNLTDLIRFEIPVAAYMTGLRFNRNDIDRPNGPRPNIVPLVERLTGGWGHALARERFGHFLDVFRQNRNIKYSGAPMFTDNLAPHEHPGGHGKTFYNDLDVSTYFANVLAPLDDEIEALLSDVQILLQKNLQIESQASIFTPGQMQLTIMVDRIEHYQAFAKFLSAPEIVVNGAARANRLQGSFKLIFDHVGQAAGSGATSAITFFYTNIPMRPAVVVDDTNVVRTEMEHLTTGQRAMVAWRAWGVEAMFPQPVVRVRVSFGG